MKEKPLVSVIITTKNEEKHIGNCIKSIQNQNYDNTEIIVVDNDSEDNTKKIAKSLGVKLYNKGPERSAQRNFGVSKSNGKYILYLDADMMLSPDVVKECVSRIKKDSNVIGLYIPERIVSLPVNDLSKPLSYYQDNFWVKVRDFERSFYDGTVIDAARFVKKEAYLKSEGFDSALTSCEDWDLNRRLMGYGKIGRIKSKIFHNERSFDITKYLKKKEYYSSWFKKYKDKWDNDEVCKKQFSAFYRLLGVFIEKGKFTKLIKHPILTFGMYYLRFNVALRYIKNEKE